MAHLAVVLLCLLPLASPAAGLEAPPLLSDLAGERLAFRVRWGVIPAADAVLEVRAAGGGTLILEAEARTLPYINWIYPVKSRIASAVVPPLPTVFRYTKDAREGWKPSRKVVVRFDPEAGIAAYARSDGKRKTLRVPPGVQDPLSVFFAYRTRPVPDDGEVRFDITDGKKVVAGRVRVLGREEVRTPAGTFSAVKVEPIIRGIGGIFKKSSGARIFVWLTDDRRRMPVKLESEVVVGSFTAELVSVRAPRPGPAPAP